jgi:hypothetical protein
MKNEEMALPKTKEKRKRKPHTAEQKCIASSDWLEHASHFLPLDLPRQFGSNPVEKLSSDVKSNAIFSILYPKKLQCGPAPRWLPT